MKQAQLISICVYSLIAIWQVVPRLKTIGRAEALIALLWIHVFRYSVLYLFTARREGYAISDFSAKEIVAGDLAGAVTALVGGVCLLCADGDRKPALTRLATVHETQREAYESNGRGGGTSARGTTRVREKLLSFA